MSKTKIDFGGVHIGQMSNDQPKKNNSDTPFHALILANLTGHDHLTESKKPKFIDRDSFENLLSATRPSLTLNFTTESSQAINLVFRELEDFEPDAIFDSVEAFANLRSLRRRLSDNTTFESAAKEMNAWATTEESSTTSIKSTSETVIEDKDNLLDFVISETSIRQENDQKQAQDNLAETLIQKIVAPYIIPASHPMQKDLLKIVDKSISDLMKLILHHADFKALEATWRSLYRCVCDIQTDTNLKLFIFNISKKSLIQDLDSKEVVQSHFYQKAIEPYVAIAGFIPWSIIVGDYEFFSTVEDINLLATLGSFAQRCNSTFVSSANSAIIGCDDPGISPIVDDWHDEINITPDSQWVKLRNTPQSSHIALCFPRTMLRLPYGEKSKPVESFDFEEIEITSHNAYLWGNSAYRLLILIAKSYQENRWNFAPGEANEVTDLPAHYYDNEGDIEMKPCAEIYLNERGAEYITKRGLLPTWSILRSNTVRMGPFISLNVNNQIICGRWEN